MKWIDLEKGALTKEQVEFIKDLRCDKNYTWRAVASACHREFDGDWNSNQIAGMDLCKLAANILGENYMEPPWN